jgi:hypothetical protein
MKSVPVFTFATLLLAATSVLAQNPVEPSAPGSEKITGDTPSAPPTVIAPTAPPTVIVVPVPEPRKDTGALDPYTPDPTRNTPGAENKN